MSGHFFTSKVKQKVNGDLDGKKILVDRHALFWYLILNLIMHGYYAPPKLIIKPKIKIFLFLDVI